MSTSSGETGLVTLVIPFRGARSAKTRLTSLNEAARERFARSCLERVLQASVAATRVRPIVLTDCPDTQAFAERNDAEWMREHRDCPSASFSTPGLPFRTLLRSAIHRVPQTRPAGLLMADLPFVARRDLELACHHLLTHDVVVAGDLQLAGTNLLLMRRPDPQLVRFNAATSYQQHCAAVRARGMRLMTVRTLGLELDVDTPADLTTLSRGHFSSTARG